VNYRNIVVIGGSAGAVRAVGQILGQLPADFPGTVLVALHLAPTGGEDWLPQSLAAVTSLRVNCPVEEQPLDGGTVYVARPDRHLIVRPGCVLTGRGPRENMWRPSIDVLFRSAAVAYGNRVIGVLTSGELDDGTSGLQAIKECGGVAIVQDPNDAAHPAMLRTALANAQIDHSVKLDQIAALLLKLSAETVASGAPIPERLRKEARMAEVPEDAPALMAGLGSPVPLSCPECGGPLWRLGSDRKELRCLVGHAFHLQTLASSTDSVLDKTLWAAIRMFEQRVNISRMLAEQERARGRAQRADLYDGRAAESRRHAQMLRALHEQRHTLLDDVGGE
jgi:two-component system, chemotaxis family, protein-glutamate methylesterase/glutaminase